MPNVSPVEPQTTAVFAYTYVWYYGGREAGHAGGTLQMYKAHHGLELSLTCALLQFKKLFHFNGGTENLNLV
jgi:hypothetical protein